MANQYTTLSLVEAEVRASTPLSASTIPTSTSVITWIEESSKEIELKTGELFSSTVASSILFDYDGENIFRLPFSELISIDKVEYNKEPINYTPNWVVLQNGGVYDYITYLPEGEIHFVSGVSSSNNVIPLSGKQRLRISYKYGSNSTPLHIQRLATLLVAKRIILSLATNQANTAGGEIQIGTIRITDPSSYGIQYLNNMNSEIDRLYKDIGNGLKTFRLTRVYDL